MRTRVIIALLITMAAAGALPTSWAEEEAPVTVEVPIAPDATWTFDLEIGHRMYPDWKDSTTVHVGEAFYLADTDFSAAVETFYPDFKIIDGERMNTSLMLTNPAVLVIVYEGEAAADSSWAFLNFPPHFSADSFFTFRLKAIEGYQEPAADEQSGEGTTP